MMAKWWAFGLWAAVAAAVVYWGLKLFVPGTPVPERTTVAALAASPRGDLTRLLGADAAPAAEAEVPASSRFQLVGVVAPKSDFPSREGVALIAVDGKPAKAYRVGAAIDGDTVLQAVAQRGARLGPKDGAATVALDIPPPAPAATGTLPGVGSLNPPPAPVPGVAPPRPLPGMAPRPPMQQPLSPDALPNMQQMQQQQNERAQALPTQ